MKNSNKEARVLIDKVSMRSYVFTIKSDTVLLDDQKFNCVLDTGKKTNIYRYNGVRSDHFLNKLRIKTSPTGAPQEIFVDVTLPKVLYDSNLYLDIKDRYRAIRELQRSLESNFGIVVDFVTTGQFITFETAINIGLEREYEYYLPLFHRITIPYKINMRNYGKTTFYFGKSREGVGYTGYKKNNRIFRLERLCYGRKAVRQIFKFDSVKFILDHFPRFEYEYVKQVKEVMVGIAIPPKTDKVFNDQRHAFYNHLNNDFNRISRGLLFSEITDQFEGDVELALEYYVDTFERPKLEGLEDKQKKARISQIKSRLRRRTVDINKPYGFNDYYDIWIEAKLNSEGRSLSDLLQGVLDKLDRYLESFDFEHIDYLKSQADFDVEERRHIENQKALVASGCFEMQNLRIKTIIENLQVTSTGLRGFCPPH